MALSQLQCLDDNHVNPRTHESKPEFLYCEDQRLALEALLQDGREAFFKYVEARGLRGFLSDPELETLTGAVEPYDPGTDLFPENAEDDEPPLSLHYWPELSDTSIPQMDLGWPDSDAYRGVTRATIYSQPPVDDQAHIKEVVRKTIAQAQKVIAVVMDVFTDVDIFRDLLDAGFKRRVSVYILLERTAIPHFLAMCQRANMHAGHLKHLRVRCTGGREFYTRSSSKVRGRMGHRFMFIDGDKAVSGSYSFTWISSRLDRNLITVVTGQAVDAFDKLFRILYMTSSSVNLRQVAKEPEPEPEPLPQPASVPPPSAAVARKLYNPKYALVLGNSSPIPSPTPSAGHNSPKKTSQENSGNPEVPDTKKRRRRRASKEAIQEAPPIHPGLTNLEKACLISYLPTWPEPDPPSDVIGFINVRDASKPTQVHLQRSEMFETSQAIRFSSPFSKPKETLPEVAKPRQLTPLKNEEMNIVQPAQVKSKAEESVLDRVQPTQLNAQPGHIKSKEEAPEQNSTAFGSKCESDKHTTKALTENTPTNQNAGHNPAHPQSSKASTPNTGRPSQTTQAVTANTPKPDSLSGPNIKQQEANLKIQSAVVFKTLELNSTQTSHRCVPTDSNTGEHTQRPLLHSDSHKQADHMKPQISETTPNIQTSTVNLSVSPSFTSAPQPVSSTSRSENKHISITTSARDPLSSLSPPPTSSSTTLSPPLPSSSTSSSLTSTPPIPKPRTIQLVIKDSATGNGKELPEVSVARRNETSTRPGVARNEPTVAMVVQKKSAEKECEIVPELQNNGGSKREAQKDAEKIGKIGEAPQQKQSGTSHETKNEEAVGLHDGRAGMQLVAGTKIEAQSMNVQEIIPKDVEAKTLTSTDSKLTPQIDSVSTVKAGTKATERDQTGCEVPNAIRKYVTQSKTYRADACELQRTSYYALTADIDVSDPADPAPTHTPLSATHISKDIAGETALTSAAHTHGLQGSPSFTAAHCTDSMPNTGKHNTHSTFQELIPKAKNTPEKSLCLHLSDGHVPGLRSSTAERESWLLTALACTPTPDGFLPRSPTPDSRTHTPDPRPYTPDYRTPTSDVSDGYVSARADSVLSTTSEEFFECSDSPSHEPVFDRAPYHNHSTTEDHVSFTHTNTPNATTVATSPICVNYNTCAVTLDTSDRDACSSATLSLSSVSSSSSLLDKKVKMPEQEKTANEENAKVVGEKGRKLSVAERRTEGDSRGTQRRGSEEGKNFKQGKDLTDTAVKHKETQPQAPQRKRLLYQPAAERLVDGGVTPGELTNEGAQPKRFSTSDLKPKKVPSEGDRADKEKAVDRTASGSSSVDRRDRPQSSRETEGQKLFHTSPRLPRRQQQDHGLSSPSRPSRPLRPMSGARPTGNRQLNQAESKALHGSLQVLDNTSSSRKPPLRPPPPVVAGAAGRKQAEVSTSQQSLLSRQPPAAQSRAKAGQSPNRHSYPKAQASFLHTHSHILPQLHSQSHNQTVPAQEAQGQEEGKTPFSVSFSRLYNLKGLKDKMSKLPAQSKRGSSSPVQGRKSTS